MNLALFHCYLNMRVTNKFMYIDKYSVANLIVFIQIKGNIKNLMV